MLQQPTTLGFIDILQLIFTQAKRTEKWLGICFLTNHMFSMA